MIAAPKVAQALFAALGDYYTWQLARKIYGKESRRAWAAVCRKPNSKPRMALASEIIVQALMLCV